MAINVTGGKAIYKATYGVELVDLVLIEGDNFVFFFDEISKS